MGTRSDDEEICPDKHLDRKQESQENFYYMFGDNLEKAPSLQVFRKKGIETLMLAVAILAHGPCIHKLVEYEDRKFVSVQTKKADGKPKETEEEKKKFSEMK